MATICSTSMYSNSYQLIVCILCLFIFFCTSWTLSTINLSRTQFVSLKINRSVVWDDENKCQKDFKHKIMPNRMAYPT